MSVTIYSWNIPAEWKNGLDLKTAVQAKEKLTELKRLVNSTLRAHPEKGITIRQALEARALQKRQISELTELLTKPLNENTMDNGQFNPFFEGKVRHNSPQIRDLYVRIVELTSTKQRYQQTQIVQLLKAYEEFVANPKSTIAEQNYDEQKEREFFERILSALLHTDRFDLEFNWIREALGVGEKGKLSITASKIMTRVNNAIEGQAVDRCMRRQLSDEDLTEITNVKYLNLLRLV